MFLTEKSSLVILWNDVHRMFQKYFFTKITAGSKRACISKCDGIGEVGSATIN